MTQPRTVNPYDAPTEPNEACHHKVATHYHGTHACYVLDRCRCVPCKNANRAYEKHRRAWAREFPYTDPPLVDAEPARRRVLDLVSQGMSLKRVAEVSGVPHGALSKLIYGIKGQRPPNRRVRSETADKLLACPLDVADGARVDAAEAKAIVAELLARGWSKTAIAQRVVGPNAWGLQSVQYSTVRAGTLRRLRELLYEEVPLRRHWRGHMYEPRPDYEWRDIEPTTPGVPDAERPFPEWLRRKDVERLWDAYRKAGGRAA